MSKTYKVVDLFGEERTVFCERKEVRRRTLFDDYEGFVEKFEPKKTTDDCYTPPEVYKVILDYVGRYFNLEGKVILRPFQPDGDYQLIDYTDNCIVIDNPPFSIISEIVRWYVERDIKFFLFAPHLTIFNVKQDVTYVITGVSIVYDNGAKVSTSFVSNVFEEIRIKGDAELKEEIERVQKEGKIKLPTYKYPKNALMVSDVSWLLNRGVSIEITKEHTTLSVGALDGQKDMGKSMFGGGLLISNNASALMAEKRREAERREAERREAERREAEHVWSLSDREREIIRSLG